MRAEKIAKIAGSQDGAIFGGYLFHFTTNGICKVYKAEALCETEKEAPPLFEFTLDKHDLICPHSNAVSFGGVYYENGDEFPLLYSTVYNTYKKEKDRREGVCCVYRIVRDGNTFTSKLIQIIKIGFVENTNLWKSFQGKEDVRPYGNFTVDRESGKLYAFVMRDRAKKTRFFSFNIPKLSAGVFNSEYGVPVLTLCENDIIDFFDIDYMRYMQGACFHDGKIYSLEGFFASDEENPPALRIISLQNKEQIFYKRFSEIGLDVEPEFIEFYNGVCYYIDGHGNAFNLFFE